MNLDDIVNMKSIRAKYKIKCNAENLEREAQAICYEQTVEVPPELLIDEHIRENVVGKVSSLRISADDSIDHIVEIDFNADLASGQLSQLLNLLFGNISIKGNIKLVDCSLPESFLNNFNGPNHGIEGVRGLTGVYGRPLLATALKPRGLSNENLASIASSFARGGGDIVKDDHNMVDSSIEDFRERVTKIQNAIERENDLSGRRTLYLPHVMAPSEKLDRYLEFLAKKGVAGVLVCPYIISLDAVRRIADFHDFVTMVHPAFSGPYYTQPEQGVTPGLLLGKLCRIAGADSSIFPNYGGRFSLAKEDCLDIAVELRKPLGNIKHSIPAPAGGMSFDRLPSMGNEYGADSIFLIGGALLSDSNDVTTGTRRYLDAICEQFPETLKTPQVPATSACEMPPKKGISDALRSYLPFLSDKFQWKGRSPTAYKQNQDLPFYGVTRHELIGSTGEKTAFNLRYFEIEKGGFTSLEKHHHTHTIICVRGAGKLIRNNDETPMNLFDIAYVDTLETHQIKNEEEEPFGFFCIVDSERDRPMKP